MFSEDENNKKRKSDREDDEEDIFKKNKKTGRSPMQHQKKLEENIAMMMEMMKTMEQTMKNLSSEIKKIRDEQQEYRKEIKELKTQNETLYKENSKMKEIIGDLDERLDQMENEKRRNNVVIQGMSIKTSDHEQLKNSMKYFMEQELNINVEIKKAIKLGEKTCLIELDNQTEKKKIMQNKNKLKNKKDGKIYINDDLSKKDRNIQKQIRTIAIQERKNGKETRIGYRKLYIDSEEWKWSNAKGKLIKSNRSSLPKND